MNHNPQDEKNNWLAPIVPELVIQTGQHGQLRIEAISPTIASWTGRPAASLIGLDLRAVFDPILPGLPVVVEEVNSAGAPVRDYRLSFKDAAGHPHVVLLQASLQAKRAALGKQQVVLRMDEMPPPRAIVEPDAEVPSFHGMVGRSAAMVRVFHKIDIYGPTEAPVLITGETGTGKELAAHALHATSRRRHRPFLAVNCSALSVELLDSELFGHERGAFTGALRTHKGRFERAHTGTLFLDEIGDMPMSVQAKLLRVLEEGHIERVGSERLLEVDVRLVTATNVPLELAIQQKNFRLDLYHRLDVLRLHMPAVRERTEDIPLLVAHFLHRFNQKYQRHVQRLTPDAIRLLQAYAWPGNIRELRNVLERVFVESSTTVIGRQAFDEWIQERQRFSPGAWNLEARDSAISVRPTLVTPYPAPSSSPYPLLPYHHVSRSHEDGSGPPPYSIEGEWSEVKKQQKKQGARHLTRQRITQAYHQAAGNITEAARLLGVHKATLYRRLNALGLTREQLDAEQMHNHTLNDD